MSHKDDQPDMSGEVVDARQWLEDNFEMLLERGEFMRAMNALNRLLCVAQDTRTKLFCYENLGVLAYRSGDVDRARQAFERASSLSSVDPGLSYALGHCASARSSWWRALMHYLTAIHQAGDRADEAEFMRAGAVAMQFLGFPDTALSMFLGALDRFPDNPWVLESISQFYEHEERWLEALDVQEALIDVLTDGLPTPSSTDLTDSPQLDRLIRRFMSLWTIDRQAIEQRVEAITGRLRAQIGMVRDDETGAERADMGLTPLNLPAGLHLLVEQLAVRERNFLLLETAQSLWAKAHHDRFDIHLSPYTLAAAIQSVAERLHWRRPTSFEQLGQLYGVDAETIQAAARLLVGRYEVRFVPEQEIYRDLDPRSSRRLVNIQRAILYGVDVGELESQDIKQLGD